MRLTAWALVALAMSGGVGAEAFEPSVEVLPDPVRLPRAPWRAPEPPRGPCGQKGPKRADAAKKAKRKQRQKAQRRNR